MDCRFDKQGKTTFITAFYAVPTGVGRCRLLLRCATCSHIYGDAVGVKWHCWAGWMLWSCSMHSITVPAGILQTGLCSWSSSFAQVRTLDCALVPAPDVGVCHLHEQLPGAHLQALLSSMSSACISVAGHTK
jgi:hypothetical protein